MNERDERLLAATALLSGNPALARQAEALGDQRLGAELCEALRRLQRGVPEGRSLLVAISNAVPAPVQYVAQRLVLVSPKLMRAILRRTGLHHRMY